MPAMSNSESFTIVVGDKHSEVPLTLIEPVPQALGLFDQFGLWGNLGVSLLGFTGAIFVLQPGGTGTPELSLVAGLSAIVLGTVLGTFAVATTGVAGARTGAPAMVLLRGLFGTELSYLPTLLNIVQCGAESANTARQSGGISHLRGIRCQHRGQFAAMTQRPRSNAGLDVEGEGRRSGICDTEVRGQWRANYGASRPRSDQEDSDGVDTRSRGRAGFAGHLAPRSRKH